MKPLEHALAYARLGFYVHPLAANTKLPLTKWKHASTRDEATIRAWLAKWPDANYAIDCEKSGLCVIDLDIKGGKNGPEELKKLEAEHEPLPETRRIDTPSGGVHLYYRGTAASVGGLRPGVDTRSTGGYVVGPGSYLDGVCYRDAQNAPVSVLPGWFGDTARQTSPGADDRVNAEAGAAPVFTADADRARAREWLRTAACVAVEGEGGDARTYRTACRLKDFGCTPEDALTLLIEEWNDQCDPPWDVQELAQKVENAYRYGARPPAADSVTVFDSEMPKEDRIVHIAAFTAKPPKREWVVEGWVPKNTASLMTGEGGVGKSAVLMQLTLAVATGTPWFGLPVLCPMPSLFIGCEDDYNELWRRYHYMLEAPEYAMMDLKRAPVYAFSRVGLESRLMGLNPDGKTPRDGSFLALLEWNLKRMPPGPKLVIIDTVPDVFGGNENDRSHVNHFSKRILGGIILRHEATIVCNAHPAKAEGSEYSGSTAWNGAFRARFQMCWHQDGSEFRTLELRKSNYARPGAQITLKRGEDGVFRTATQEDALADACGALYRAILAAQAIGVWYSLDGVKGHNLAKFVVNGRDGKPLSEQAKTDAAHALMKQGMFVEEAVAGHKSRKLTAVTLEDMFS